MTVKRFNSSQPLASVKNGHWVKASDYDALADRLAEVEAQLKMVLDREAATCARYDAKLDAAEARLAEVEAVLSDAREALEAAEELHQVGVLAARVGLTQDVPAKRNAALAAIRAFLLKGEKDE